MTTSPVPAAPFDPADLTDPTPPPRLQVEGLCSAVVAPVGFCLGAGTCLAISGPSGAGKTRLLRLIADLDEGQGTVLLDGVPRDSYPAPQWRTRVVYQSAESAWWLPNVIQHVEPALRDQAVMLASRLALGADRLAADITQLSTGERQRAALVRSLLMRPAVLMLDEPSSALDADNVERMEEVLLEQMRGGLSLLLVTHSREQQARIAHGCVTVNKRGGT